MKTAYHETRGHIIHDEAEDRADGQSDANLALVNKFALKPMKREEINIKSMWLCNDMIDSYFSRFNEESLGELASLCPGQSMLVGHKHDDLPIGRFFKARVQTREDNHLWLRAWFYWPMNMEGANDLLVGIDSGLYREVSVCWTYGKAICSICGNDIRDFEKCNHVPGRKYPDETGVEKLCWYETGDIKSFIEASIVCKGGQVGTSLDEERKMAYAERAKIMDKSTMITPESIEQAKAVRITESAFADVPKGKYRVCPNYDSARVAVVDGKVMFDNKDITDRLPLIANELKEVTGKHEGFIFKKRGNARLHNDCFVKWLDSDSRNDFSIHIKLFDDNQVLKDTEHVQSIRFLLSDDVTKELASQVASREGVIIYNDEVQYIVKEITHEEKTKARSTEKTEGVSKKDPSIADRQVEGIYKVYDGDKQFYQFRLENKWYRTPVHVNASMLFREVESLDLHRSMRVSDIVISNESGLITIKSKPISGSYRMNNIVLNGQRYKTVRFVEK